MSTSRERVFTNWFEVTDRPGNHLLQRSALRKGAFPFQCGLRLVELAGSVVGWRRDNPYAVPYLVVLLAFPLVVLPDGHAGALPLSRWTPF